MTTPIDRPFLLLAGVRKCGTTALFRTLQRHPEIVPSRIKEPQYFALSPKIVLANLDWYRNLFQVTDSAPGIWMDGSTLAFMSTPAPDLVSKVFPSAKVILLIRDPAKRAYSAYVHMVRQVDRIGERRSFAQVLGSLEGASDLDKLIERERTAISQASESGSLNGDYYTRSFHRSKYNAPFDTEYEDPLTNYRYFEESCYSRVLPRWEEAFKGNVKVVVFERLLANPKAILADLCDFLEIDAGVVDLHLQRENAGRVPQNRLVRKLLELRSQNRWARNGVDFMKQAGLNNLVDFVQRRFLWGRVPKLDATLHKQAVNVLEPEYNYWFERDPGLRTFWDCYDAPSADLRSLNSDLCPE